MKRLSFLLGMMLLGLGVQAQQNYFLYVQTDNRQPFYVKINNELYSSSSSGYAIIPKLQKDTYTLFIGFPKKEWPEQKIIVPVNADAGYSLKNFQEKGWGLFNMQTLAVLMPQAKTETGTTTITNANEFATTLANVVNTPSLNEKKVINKIEETTKPKEVTEAAVEAPETAAQKPIPTTEEKPIEQATVKQLSTVIDAAGIAMVFTSTYNNSIDTIKLFIADEKAAPVFNSDGSVKGKAEELPKKTDAAEPPVTEDKRFLAIELPNPNSAVVPEKTSKTETISEPITKPVHTEAAKPNDPETQTTGLTFNSDCKALATSDDFLKTRKKMASENNAEDMITAAKKRFKQACYSTEQIKNLSVLFLKDETRYNFFDAAYPFVHDTQNFPQLVSSLTDEYYISRFKAMLR